MINVIKDISALTQNTSAFAQMAISAIIVWLGSIFVTIVDLTWLVCDATAHFEPYHIVIGIGLSAGLLTIIISGAYLFKSVHKYLTKHEKVLRRKKNVIQQR